VKVLALSDRVVDFVYSVNVVKHFDGVELIVGCGDLPVEYLEFVVSMYNIPLVYVPGNHDNDNFSVPGGESVDGKLVEVAGLRIMGLGGSPRYKPKGKHQYTEYQMRLRVWRLLFRAIARKGLSGGQIDLLVTHSPPLGIHDSQDVAHTGFASFHSLIGYARPKWMLHGHSHVNRNIEETVSELYGTKIVNIFPYRIVEIERER
jgi:Icc-related predicted phosphoesterase